jgi:hypothetical protein
MNYHNLNLVDCFSHEIAQIDDSDLQKFVKQILNECKPCHAWLPASASGKFHPQYALGEGGLVRHTKVVVQNVMELIEATPAVQSERDELIAAAIIHDMCKYEKSEETTCFEHPALMGDKCDAVGFKNIARLVRAHQGIWITSKVAPGFVNKKPEKFDEYILHYADLMASRPYLQVTFDSDTGEIVLDPNRKFK